MIAALALALPLIAQDAQAALARGDYAEALEASANLEPEARASLRTRARWFAGDLAGALAEARRGIDELPEGDARQALRYFGLQLALELRDLERARRWHDALSEALPGMGEASAAYYAERLPELTTRLELALELRDDQDAARSRAVWLLAGAALGAGALGLSLLRR